MKQDIKTIDYEHIAALAEAIGANFEHLRKRAENGAQTDEEILGGTPKPPDPDQLFGKC